MVASLTRESKLSDVILPSGLDTRPRDDEICLCNNTPFVQLKKQKQKNLLLVILNLVYRYRSEC